MTVFLDHVPGKDHHSVVFSDGSVVTLQTVAERGMVRQNIYGVLDDTDQLEHYWIIDIREMPHYSSELAAGLRPAAGRLAPLTGIVLHSFSDKAKFVAWAKQQDCTLTMA